jgi:hypothetical protein
VGGGGVAVMARGAVMGAMAFAMMMLSGACRANSSNEDHWNDRNQSQLENVFHVKSPDSITLGKCY